MIQGMVRAHIVIPEEVVRAVDELVGERGRSKFFKEAVEEKLKKAVRTRLIEEMEGSLEGVDTPGWETPESTDRWVRASRDADPARLKSLLGAD